MTGREEEEGACLRRDVRERDVCVKLAWVGEWVVCVCMAGGCCA